MTQTTRYKRRQIALVPAPDIQPDDLITMKDAAKLLGCTIQNVSLKADKGHFTAIIDTEAPNQQHSGRLLLRSEIEQAARGR